MRAAALSLCSVVIAGIGCATIVACTHDFGQFDNGTESEGGGGGGGEAGSDGGCTPDVACTNNAKKCGSDCQTTESQCESSCGGGGSGRCRSNCQDAGATCDTECVGYCVQCAGCSAQTACTGALK